MIPVQFPHHLLRRKQSSGHTINSEMGLILDHDLYQHSDDDSNDSNGSSAPELVGLPGDAKTRSLLEDLLQCPVCLEISKPPIFQCLEGHTLCSHCKPRVKGKCPLCRGKVPPNLRNRALEAFYNTANFSCPNKPCGVTMRGDEMEGHVGTCSYRTVKCNFNNPSCPCGTWNNSKGLPSQKLVPFIEMPNHLHIDHGVPVHNSGEYCVHQDYLQNQGMYGFETHIPLAIWRFHDLIILQQLTLLDDAVVMTLQLLNEVNDPSSEELLEKIVVDLQVIRRGIDCAPSIRYGLYNNLKISKYGEETKDNLYYSPEKCLVFPEKEFKTNVARYEGYSQSFMWTTRIDFKLPSSEPSSCKDGFELFEDVMMEDLISNY